MRSNSSPETSLTTMLDPPRAIDTTEGVIIIVDLPEPVGPARKILVVASFLVVESGPIAMPWLSSEKWSYLLPNEAVYLCSPLCLPEVNNASTTTPMMIVVAIIP